MQSFHEFFVQLGDYKKMINSSSSVKSSLKYSSKMKILSFVFAVILTVSVSALPGASARANQQQNGNNGLVSTKRNSSPFKICIDDSDCLKLGQGDKYACFQVSIQNELSSFISILFELNLKISVGNKHVLRSLTISKF